MRKFEIEDKVLFVDNNGLIQTNHGIYQVKKQGFDCLDTIHLRTGRIVEKIYKHHFILAETDDIKRALDHIQKDMWVRTKKGVVYKVDLIDLFSSMPDDCVFHSNGIGWVSPTYIKKIYFYDPGKKDKNNKILELEDTIKKATLQIQELKGEI